jgi:hypothetical protein
MLLKLSLFITERYVSAQDKRLKMLMPAECIDFCENMQWCSLHFGGPRRVLEGALLTEIRDTNEPHHTSKFNVPG